jgi:hypothetical protein
MWKWIIWGSGLAFTLAIFAASTLLYLGVNEELCFDRRPWWGPPESGDPNSSCSGHMWEKHEAGYGWFGPGPK